jgi:gamma-glutamylcyclotransferase (GGCT)/AIG2-like uncharacterized protein YtfP
MYIERRAAERTPGGPPQYDNDSHMTTPAAILLFSYGTLQDRQVQVAHFGRELRGHPDSMPGYRQTWLQITDSQVIATSGKTRHPIVEPSPDCADEVVGSVFEITAQELVAADKYEVSDYKRVAVKLKSGLQAWVYVRA